MIEAAADKFYDDIVDKIINPNFVSKEVFIEKMAIKYKQVVGESFKDFLKKNEELGNVYEDVTEILLFLEPTSLSILEKRMV
jgi:hypothetical protein